jgi:methylenetetrahydrofolate dehydrogenase (NADP+)/methenyltetrahydrofolate cyclohydrolase
MIVIDGKKVSSQIVEKLKQEINLFKTKNIVLRLVIIQIGSNPASNIYIRNKIKLGEQLGIIIELKQLSEDTTNEVLLEVITQLNLDAAVNGILVQMPLPSHINETKIIAHIAPNKDVDCFHLENIGKL